jgi:hypothetical protein
MPFSRMSAVSARVSMRAVDLATCNAVALTPTRSTPLQLAQQMP